MTMFENRDLIDFQRNDPGVRELPLVPMIDVVFILIIFFMLTTSFMKMESMELLLPSAISGKKVNAVNMAHIYLHGDGRITYGQRPVDKMELKRTLESIFASYPEQRTVVLVGDEVSLQALVDVMDIVYLAGGKNVFVREWRQQQPLERVWVPVEKAK